MKLQSINPATGIEIATYAEHSPTEVDRRLQLAHDGWKKWSATPVAERTALLIRLADLLEERAERYGKLIVSEMGKPIGEAIGEVKKCALGARHFRHRKRHLRLSNRLSPCYISRARTLRRRTDFRGMEQPGSSSGS